MSLEAPTTALGLLRAPRAAVNVVSIDVENFERSLRFYESSVHDQIALLKK